MKDKGHFLTSVVKSVIRIATCVCAFTANNLFILCSGLLLAEILGIIEELLDRR